MDTVFGGHCILISLAIEINKIIRVYHLQLLFVGIAYVYLLIVFHVCPLCLAVEPCGGDGRCDIEFSSLHRY